MTIEKREVKKTAERPDEVICQICGRGFHLLHRSHLRIHGILSQAQYRELYAIGNKMPLNSETYARRLRKIQESPNKQAFSSQMGLNWQVARRVALVRLEQEDFFSPRRTAYITGIPIQTIYSAIRRGALPSIIKELMVKTDEGIKSSGDTVQGVKLEDMLKYATKHRPKKPVRKCIRAEGGN